jgi:hypothetical protein
MNRRIRLYICCGLILVLACSTVTASNLYVQKELRIGVLVSLTGLWSTLGRNTEVALEAGAAKINA